MGYEVHPAADIFPRLPKDELRELANDIKSHGLREAIWLWKDSNSDVLIDGRNRLAACEIAGVIPEFRHYAGSNPVEFIISQNIHRRHLTAGQKAAAAHELKPFFEAKAVERRSQAKGKPRGQKAASVSADRREEKPNRKRKSSEQAAKAVGSSGRSVERYERVLNTAPDLAAKVKADDISLDRAERIVRDRAAESQRADQARQDAKASKIEIRCDIRLGDFREVLSDVKDVQAIITDPPYPKEFLPLLDDLAAFADRVLLPDGILAVLMGQTYLPEVYRRLEGGRSYRWTCCYLTSGAGYVSHSAKVQTNWKPLLLYGGGPRLTDMFRAENADATSKANHKWGQDFTAFETIVERLTKKGDTIVDPFCGAGTTLLAAYSKGRHSIGSDIDKPSIKRSKERVFG